MNIGFIGLGQMGSEIATNLIKAGHTLTVWNRSPAAVEKLVQKGAKAAKTPQEAMTGEVVFSMLASDKIINTVGLDGALLDSAPKGLIHVNMATVSIAKSRELTKAHADRGLVYVASPVFGRPEAAEAAKLVVVTAGPAETLKKLDPLFAAIGQRTVIVGADPWQANLFKISGNFMVAAAHELMGEAFALLRKGGVDPAVFHDVITAGLFPGVIFVNYGKMILAENYENAAFPVTLGLKDVDLARDAAADLKVPMLFGEVLHNQYNEAIKQGMSDLDWSSVAKLVAKQAGL